VIFHDRHQAGAALAESLARRDEGTDLVVGLAPGGVVLAAPIASRLNRPLGVACPSLMRATSSSGPSYGAVAADGASWIDELRAHALGIGFARLTTDRTAALGRARERQRWLGPAFRTTVSGASVILVDEGLLWPGRIAAVARSMRHRGAARVLAAVPVATADAVERVRAEVDEVVTLRLEGHLEAIDTAYRSLEAVDLATAFSIARDHAARSRSPVPRPRP
jgi:putative phosphoribosyl transferase